MDYWGAKDQADDAEYEKARLELRNLEQERDEAKERSGGMW